MAKVRNCRTGRVGNRTGKRFEWVVDFDKFITPSDVRKTRVFAAVGYVFFFIPLVFCDDSQYARFHVNQSILNLLMSVLLAVVLGFIPVVGPYLVFVQELLCVVWMVRGIVLSLLGKARGIPVVGNLTVLAYRYPEQFDGSGPVF